MTELILNECIEKTQTESSLAKPYTYDEMNIELSEEFLMKLQCNAYYGTFDEDVVDYISKVLEMLDLIKIPNVDSHQESDYGNPPNTTTDSSFKPYLNAQEKDDIEKEMSSLVKGNIDSSSNFEGIAAIVNKIDSLGHDMKKIKENVHAIQVGCQTCEGAHLDKEFPLNEEVMSVEEVEYGEFGCSSPFSNGAKYHVGMPVYYKGIENHPSFGEKRPSLEELMNKHLKVSTRRSAEMEEWVKKLQENSEINTQNQSDFLKIWKPKSSS
nr:hypothetical protein [Tanacetum cinerariifolium]